MEIRRMNPADVELALEWAAAEGWNPGRHDATPFLAADPGGFLIGELDGEPAAMIACVRYGTAFGFVGLYLVRPDLRGNGLGIEIWRAGHERFGDRAVGLDAVDAQVANYERAGYVAAGHTYRYRSESGGADAGRAERIEPVRYEDVASFDARAFLGPREAFLRGWLAQPEARVLGLLRDGELAAYGVRRRCREGCKIGPLFATDATGAEALLDALVAGLDEPYTLDVPRGNAAATALVERRGMTPVFRTSRMYRGDAPDYARELVFGVTTLELG
jgi:GNAT acetyltransferase-like protein/acetyltransferase (GNAT) family protein